VELAEAVQQREGEEKKEGTGDLENTVNTSLNTEQMCSLTRQGSWCVHGILELGKFQNLVVGSHFRHYRILHSTVTEYIFFSVIHRIFSKVGHILEYKACLNKYKKINFLNFIRSHGLRLEINSKRNYRKYTNTWIE
jgi:hypothetical protein